MINHMSIPVLMLDFEKQISQSSKGLGQITLTLTPYIFQPIIIQMKSLSHIRVLVKAREVAGLLHYILTYK